MISNVRVECRIRLVRRAGHLDMVKHAIAVEVSMEPWGWKVQLAQRAAAVQVHRLDALLQVRHQHVRGRACRAVLRRDAATGRVFCHLHVTFLNTAAVMRV